MRTTLDLDADVLTAARELAASQRRSLGRVISELARRGLTPARVHADGPLPVIRVPAGTPPLTAEMVRRALDDSCRSGFSTSMLSSRWRGTRTFTTPLSDGGSLATTAAAGRRAPSPRQVSYGFLRTRQCCRAP